MRTVTLAQGFISLAVFLLCFQTQVFAQSSVLAPISTSFPRFSLSTDARSAGLAESNFASNYDAYGLFWNPAGLTFSQKKAAFSVSYSPWGFPGGSPTFISQEAVWLQVAPKVIVGTSFSLYGGKDLPFSDLTGTPIGVSDYFESSTDLHWGWRLNEYWAIGGGVRYLRIHPNELPIFERTIGAAALDLGAHYQRHIAEKLLLKAAIAAQHVGPKVQRWVPQPISLPITGRLGYSLSYEFSELVSITLHHTLNKLLVPSSIYDPATRTITEGGYAEKSFVTGMFTSFWDSEQGLSGEIAETNMHIGLDFLVGDYVHVRLGRAFYGRAQLLPNNGYTALGLGLGFDWFRIDGSLTLSPPRSGASAPSIYHEAWRVSMQFMIPDHINILD